MRVVFLHIVTTTDGTSQASTATERTVLQGRRPVGASPNRRPPKIPSGAGNPNQSNQKRGQPRHDKTHFHSRALIPVGRDPLQVKIDDGPQDVGDPRAIISFRLDQPFGVFDQVGGAERRAVCPLALRQKRKARPPKIHAPAAGEPIRAFGSRILLILTSNTASAIPPVNTFPARLITCCVLVRAWTTSSTWERRLASSNTVSSLIHGW